MTSARPAAWTLATLTCGPVDAGAGDAAGGAAAGVAAGGGAAAGGVFENDGSTTPPWIRVTRV
jgi:hypothetical protein